jgi:hypothetical protein
MCCRKWFCDSHVPDTINSRGKDEANIPIIDAERDLDDLISAANSQCGLLAMLMLTLLEVRHLSKVIFVYSVWTSHISGGH